jgi:integration host factor subunit beta
MATVTKKDLIDRISTETAIKRTDVKLVIQAFLDQVTSELGNGNRLEFRDFGVFEVRDRAARVAQNPKTLEPVQVPSRRTVKFKIGRKMREALDQGELQDAPIVEVRTNTVSNLRP